MSVFVLVDMCAYVLMSVHMCTYVLMSVHMCAYVLRSVDMCANAHVQVYMFECTVYVHRCVRVHINTHMYVCVYVCVYLCGLIELRFPTHPPVSS